MLLLARRLFYTFGKQLTMSTYLSNKNCYMSCQVTAKSVYYMSADLLRVHRVSNHRAWWWITLLLYTIFRYELSSVGVLAPNNFSRKIPTLPSKNMNLPYSICNERIFVQPIVHVQQNILKKLVKVDSSHLNASFGTFCVQIGQLFVA